ncbi:MAG: ABC transporter ATP-binding protein [Dehalococcoidia bacterium]|nr:ABC transporter ATP-binding protein [Dehalococcoidia bacterium]
MTEAIVCKGLSKRYGRLLALDNLDLHVEEKTIFGFLGPNGAGKTSALRILAGLSRATSGKAWVAGEEARLNSSVLQRRLGYLPEDPAFYNWMSANEYLTFVGELFKLPSAELAARRAELLALVDLAGAASRRIGGYSRGMKQRLGIAQALMNRPAVLLLDEPCSALDPIGRLEVLETLVKLKEQKTTVFMSSHILADVERVCDVVAVIDKGKLIVQAGVEELRQRFAHPVFELEFDQPADSAIPLLQKVPGVTRVVTENRAGGVPVLRVHVTDTAKARHGLLHAVETSNLALRRYEIVLPSLEEVFVELVANHKEQSR